MPLASDVAFSWVSDSVDQTSTFADELLHHEQGHYDLAAFLYADLFSEIYEKFIEAAKPRLFANQLELNRTMNKLREERRSLIHRVYKKYDADCGTVGSTTSRDAQKKWDMYCRFGRVNRISIILKEKGIIP